MTSLRYFFLIVFMSIPLWGLVAQEDTEPAPEPKKAGTVDDYLRMPGEFNVVFGAGTMVPLYSHAFDYSDFGPMGLFAGLDVAAAIDAYITSNFKIGASLAFALNKGKNTSYGFFLPVAFRTIYEARIASFSFPLGAEYGMIISTYNDLSAINLLFKLKAGMFWHFNRQWSVGFDLSFWVVPQVVWDDLSKSRVATMTEVLLCGQYHF
jgi:hypothetical protein